MLIISPSITPQAVTWYIKKILLLSFLTLSLHLHANNNYVSGQLFVKLQADYSIEDLSATTTLESTYDITKIEQTFTYRHQLLSNIYTLYFTQTDKTQALIRELQQLAAVVYAEQVPLYHTFCVPNDPLYPSQYATDNTNLAALYNIVSNGSCDFDATNCNNEIVIALIDDAVLLSHEDLAPKIWVNAAEIAADGIDNDGNGYIDDINGWDAADNDNDPNPDPASVSNSVFTHGTHCAGIAAAATNNSIGIASPGFNARIMAVKTAPDGSGGNTLPAAYEGVEYAIATNADIMSMSWGGGAYSATYQALFDVANSVGITCIAAAGNSSTSTPMYPASYEHIISVGATNINNEVTYFSNFGATIDIMAPGEDINSTLAGSNNAYGELSGTSMACPFVSGAAAAMLCFDSSLSPEAIEDIMEQSALNIDAENPNFVGQMGAGLINFTNTINFLAVPPIPDFTIDFDIYCPNESITISNFTAGPGTIAYDWNFPGGTPSNSTDQTPTVSYATAGTYTITLTATNEYGSNNISYTITIGIPTATLSGGGTIVQGGTSSLQVEYNGSLPYDLVLNNGTNDSTILGISQTPYFINVSPQDTSTYTLVSAGNGSCAANLLGSAEIIVWVIEEGEICQYSQIYGTGDDNSIRYSSYYDADAEILYRVGGNPRFSAIDAATGTILWEQDYPSLQGAQGIVKLPNGNFVLCASDPSGPSSNWYAYGMDALGNILWATRYPLGGRQRIPRLVTVDGNNVVIAGWFNTTGGSSDDIGMYKIDGTNGAVLQAQSVAVAGDDQASELTSDGSNGFYIAGEVEHDRTVFLLHFDQDLNYLEGNEYIASPDYYNSANYKAIQTNDGGFAITAWRNGGGETLEYSTLIKLDSSWEVAWVRSFYPMGSTDVYMRPSYVAEDASSSLYVVGLGTYANSFTEGYLLKFDEIGNLLAGKRPQNPSDFSPLEVSQFPFIIINENSPGYEVIYGNNFNNGTFGGRDFALTRTDTELNSCLLFDAEYIVQNETWSRVNTSISISSVTVAAEDIPFSNSAYISNISTPCIECQLSDCDFECGLVASDSVVCVNTSIDFSTEACVDGIAYQWIVNDTLTIADNESVTYEFTEAGNFTVGLYASDGTCISNDQILVQVGATLASAGEEISICLGDSAQLSASGGDSYSWSPSESLSDANIANPIATPDTSTTYYVDITDANGCQLTDSVQVWVNPLPVILPVTIDTTICNADTVSIQISNLTPISNYLYTWTPTTGLSCTDCPNPEATVTESTVYTLNLTNALGCSNSQTFSINIFTIDDLSSTIDTSLCASDSIFVANAWQNTSGTYTDTLISSLGCDSLLITNVTIIDLPTANNTLTICEGDSVFVAGAWQNTTGLYYDTIPSLVPEQCDSLMVTELLVNDLVLTNIDTTICAGDSLLINDIWYSSSINLSDTLTAINTCDSIVSINLSVFETAALFIDTTICLGTPYFVGGNFQTSGGLYTDTIVSSNGLCQQIISTQLAIIDCLATPDSIVVPNAFSPNNDGINDQFGVSTTFTPENYELKVFNRWGQEVFVSTDYQQKWDGNYNGNSCGIGVYVWYVRYRNQTTGEQNILKGNVTLVR